MQQDVQKRMRRTAAMFGGYAMQQFCEVCRATGIMRFAFYASVAGHVCFLHRLPASEPTNRQRAETMLASPVPPNRGELRRRLASLSTG